MFKIKRREDSKTLKIKAQIKINNILNVTYYLIAIIRY